MMQFTYRYALIFRIFQYAFHIIIMHYTNSAFYPLPALALFDSLVY